MKTDNFRGTSNEELINYLNQSVEALRKENLRLMDVNERLTNKLEVIDAEHVSNNYPANRLYKYDAGNRNYID